jgi:hypothetical protein
MHTSQLANIFSAKDDSRIEFFARTLTSEQLDTLLSLRKRLLESTKFSLGTLLPDSTRLSLSQSKPETFEIVPTLLEAISPEKISRKNFFASKTLSKYGKSLYMGEREIYIIFLFIGLLTPLHVWARNKDLASKKIIAERIAEGICTLVKLGCKRAQGRDLTRVDCFMPRDLCSESSYVFIITMVTLMTFLYLLGLAAQARGEKISQLLDEEIQHSDEYDGMLSQLCAKNHATRHPDWSEQISIAGTRVTIRAIALAALCSFDNHTYTQLFAHTLPLTLTKKEFDSYAELGLTRAAATTVATPFQQAGAQAGAGSATLTPE